MPAVKELDLRDRDRMKLAIEQSTTKKRVTAINWTPQPLKFWGSSLATLASQEGRAGADLQRSGWGSPVTDADVGAHVRIGEETTWLRNF